MCTILKALTGVMSSRRAISATLTNAPSASVQSIKIRIAWLVVLERRMAIPEVLRPRHD
jgi:hypothetical protein